MRITARFMTAGTVRGVRIVHGMFLLTGAGIHFFFIISRFIPSAKDTAATSGERVIRDELVSYPYLQRPDGECLGRA